ncbi:MAG: Spy/CpxP family protein refolding chaperone [Deltaproteobacteria bacterium]|nr:Spy/CpxP family protein refolding chaperone [Deltaproteobacteria bacterium]
MHPAFFSWLSHARRSGHGCGPSFHSHHGPRHHHEGPEAFFSPGGHDGPPGFGGRFGGHGPGGGDFFGGGPFGVRRPLRFLAHKLDLSEAQVAELARIIEELKTERAQAEVDHRRTVTALADAVEGATFGEARAREGGDLRVKSAERLRDAVTTALSRIHALLDDKQRKQLSYLIRTGVVTL